MHQFLCLPHPFMWITGSVKKHIQTKKNKNIMFSASIMNNDNIFFKKKKETMKKHLKINKICVCHMYAPTKWFNSDKFLHYSKYWLQRTFYRLICHFDLTFQIYHPISLYSIRDSSSVPNQISNILLFDMKLLIRQEPNTLYLKPWVSESTRSNFVRTEPDQMLRGSTKNHCSSVKLV